MTEHTVMLIAFGLWFAFMISASLGLFYWACFGKIEKNKQNFEWWK
ncbi:hypothetical protein BIS47_177 [Klebsiella phage vB_KpnM_BIS47]|uniref:Uncharacterized protein n=1 Tax=Klebsiella phage vB_KpnM_BIS47 TaxID=1907784 RepID=A0A1V0E743_9CAUD|nr:hypothetical protein BIS47_177 [Klebsiella phage vB_KpnM_BIS47]ARB12681.1 hypothetical protein BIS47_177 [Klebsiella phage vB_KpnM_BIS47]